MKDPNIPGLIKNYTVLSLGTTKSYHYIWTWSLKGIDVPGSKKYTYFSRYNKTIITLHLNLEHERCPRFKDMHFILLNKPYRYIWTWNMKEPDGKQHDIPPRKARKHLTGDGVKIFSTIGPQGRNMLSKKTNQITASKTIFVVKIEVTENKEPRMKLIIL